MKRLAVVVLLAAGCSTQISSGHVGPSFQATFTGLYAQQQHLLGRTDFTADDLQPLTSCQRTGADQDGPGEDWLCAVQYVDSGTSGAQTFELQVKPDGCWKADGPPTAQPARIVNPLTQQTSPNPLAEFDGCFDTSW